MRRCEGRCTDFNDCSSVVRLRREFGNFDSNLAVDTEAT